MSEIKGKVVVITGGSSGIGEATARYLAERGADIVVGARRTDRLKAICADIQKNGGRAVYQAVDVTRRDAVKALVDFAVKAYGRVDVIVNNAGLMPLSLLEQLKVDEWDRMIDVNIKGTLYGIAAVLPIFRAQKSGHVINISSVAGHKIRPGGAVYSATKFAVRALSEGLREEAGDLFRVTVISPGAVESELAETISDPALKKQMDDYRAKVQIPAKAIAEAIAYAIGQPATVDVNEILIRPTAQQN
ncbi:MAG TPA: SDR family oxidoreductase [Pseudorhodoplanes sp.]|jgi:NADP-dependent 3-hydroxy acid dehydrogenase YdfG|nr:SDR family oxidoreductase [Pseudorhodoplanes sp.]